MKGEPYFATLVKWLFELVDQHSNVDTVFSFLDLSRNGKSTWRRRPGSWKMSPAGKSVRMFTTQGNGCPQQLVSSDLRSGERAFCATGSGSCIMSVFHHWSITWTSQDFFFFFNHPVLALLMNKLMSWMVLVPVTIYFDGGCWWSTLLCTILLLL